MLLPGHTTNCRLLSDWEYDPVHKWLLFRLLFPNAGVMEMNGQIWHRLTYFLFRYVKKHLHGRRISKWYRHSYRCFVMAARTRSRLLPDWKIITPSNVKQVHRTRIILKNNDTLFCLTVLYHIQVDNFFSVRLSYLLVAVSLTLWRCTITSSIRLL